MLSVLNHNFGHHLYPDRLNSNKPSFRSRKVALALDALTLITFWPSIRKVLSAQVPVIARKIAFLDAIFTPVVRTAANIALIVGLIIFISLPLIQRIKKIMRSNEIQQKKTVISSNKRTVKKNQVNKEYSNRPLSADNPNSKDKACTINGSDVSHLSHVHLSNEKSSSAGLESRARKQGNYPRLYDKGASIIQHPLVQTQLKAFSLLQPTQKVKENGSPCLQYTFSVSTPEAILAGNLHVDEMIRKTTFAEIRANPKYAEYNLKVTDGDFRGVNVKIDIIKDALLKSHFIDAEGFLRDDAITNPIKLGSLKEEFKNDMIFNQVLDVLRCVQYRSTDHAIMRRLIDAKLLDSQILAEMSNGKISPEMARGLLARLAVKDPKKNYPVLNLSTGDYNQDIVNKIRKEQYPGLKLTKENPALDHHTWEEAYGEEMEKLLEPNSLYFREVQSVKNRIMGLLKPFFPYVSAGFVSTFKKELDHETILGSCNTLYNRFFEPDGWERQWAKRMQSHPTSIQALDLSCAGIRQLSTSRPNSYLDLAVDHAESLNAKLKEPLMSRDEKDDQVREKFENNSSKIHRFLRKILPKLHEKAMEVFSEERWSKYDDLHLKYEALRKKIDSDKIDDLEKIFQENKHILHLFLRYSTESFRLEKALKYQIVWIMDEIQVEEELTREKTGVIARRLQFPYVEGKKDLVYFSEDVERSSVINCWNKLSQDFSLSDSEMATYCLELYTKGHTEAAAEIKQFLVPLVLLLLGKEPALDRASLLSNYILFKAVNLGLYTFKEALEMMPMVPSGAVSAKQFLLHLIDRPIDSMTYVQSGRSKEKGLSYYLTHANDILGKAADWIDKYDIVTSVASRCSVERLSALDPVPTNDPVLNKLKTILEKLYNHGEIPHDQLGEALSHENGLFDDEDLVGEWVINYMFESHPLAN